MLTVTEQKSGNEIYFIVADRNHHEKICCSEIYYRTVVRQLNERSYFLLYNTDMAPVREVFEFLNYTNSSQGLNTRIKSLGALKLLYIYKDIIGKAFSEFTVTDINNLKQFLKGISFQGTEISVKLLTRRSNRTINGYFAVFRSFFAFLGIECKPLLKAYTLPQPLEEKYGVGYTYQVSEKLPSLRIEVPHYITPTMFGEILDVIREKHTLREECIVRFMFQHGFRIGEVLGITNDDLLMEKIGDQWFPVIYLRNRLSGKHFQKAKTCLNVRDRSSYFSKDYQEYGYHKIIIDNDLYELLNQYVSEAHSYAEEHYRDTYRTETLADRVRKNEPYEEPNRYLFITRYGRLLRSDTWNKVLRSIFMDAEIVPDKTVRKHNLNHRFRHGFAMYQVEHMHRNELELMRLMRHSSLQSVAAYFKPTLTDQIKLK